MKKSRSSNEMFVSRIAVSWAFVWSSLTVSGLEAGLNITDRVFNANDTELKI